MKLNTKTKILAVGIGMAVFLGAGLMSFACGMVLYGSFKDRELDGGVFTTTSQFAVSEGYTSTEVGVNATSPVVGSTTSVVTQPPGVVNTQVPELPLLNPAEVALGGGVSYGIHSVNPGKYGSKITGLGVSVVKIQIRVWDYGSCEDVSLEGLDQQVGAIKALGKKVLLSVVTQIPGSGEASNSPPTNPDVYANCIARLVGKYADTVWGVEIWNEANLSREWNTPDPSAYVGLLRASYERVKAVNPSVVVVSGALSPTWHNPPVNWDDLVYLEEMNKLGASQWLDCIGVHANSLSFTPSAWSNDGVHWVGSDKNTHHSWYYQDTMWGSYNSMSPRKPICITEFGIASPEAIGGTPSGFEWSSTTSLQEQADWLTEGVGLAEKSGIVKLMVFWNLDFSPECGGCVDEKTPYSILSPQGQELTSYIRLKQVLSGGP